MSSTPKVVFFDLETTGLYNSNPDILQIGAITLDGNDSFDLYVHPTKPIQKKASEVNKLYFQYNKLFRLIESSGSITIFRQCYTVPAKEALDQFMNWLKKDVGGNVILVAYNGFRFDFKILLKKLLQYNIDYQAIVGLVDPFETAQELYKHLPSRKMEDMLVELKVNTAQTHNALLDSVDLRSLTIALAQKFAAPGGVAGWMKLFQNPKYFKSVMDLAMTI